jgi:hypothetical protein
MERDTYQFTSQKEDANFFLIGKINSHKQANLLKEEETHERDY